MLSDYPITVIKMGGTSQNLIPYQNVKSTILNLKQLNQKVFIVVSALSKVTNLLFDNPIDCEKQLINIHTEFIKKLGFSIDYEQEVINNIKFIIDFVFSTTKKDDTNRICLGENLSSKILNSFLNYPEKDKIKSHVLLATQLLKFNSENQTLKSLVVNPTEIIKNFEQNNVIITQGFIANNFKGNPVILMGRGSSDTSGAVFAKFLKAKQYQIWTDVSGVYNIDPRLTNKPIIFNKLDFNMAQEMAGMGAKVLHPYSIKPCQEENIPIILKNSFDINNKGTLISNETSSHPSFTLQNKIWLIKIKTLNMWHGIGFAADIFDIFSKQKIDIDIITTSAFEITITTKSKNNLQSLQKAVFALAKQYQIDVIKNCNQVSVIYPNIISPLLNKIHQISTKYQIELEAISSNNYSISFILKENANAKELLLELSNSKLDI